jgi:hypothetical protein
MRSKILRRGSIGFGLTFVVPVRRLLRLFAAGRFDGKVLVVA